MYMKCRRHVCAGCCVHFSIEDILTLQRLAADNNMIIIPLVQTFGHMEVVLFCIWDVCCNLYDLMTI